MAHQAQVQAIVEHHDLVGNETGRQRAEEHGDDRGRHAGAQAMAQVAASRGEEDGTHCVVKTDIDVKYP